MITNLPSNSLLGRLGLRNGDIMKGVNGRGLAAWKNSFKHISNCKLTQCYN